MANIVNQYGQVKVGVRIQSISDVTSLLLDTYTGATAAYSLRKLRNAYTGSAIRVRRSSDNTSQDIGFDVNGNLDTVSMLSFVGAGNGFVSIWYDQSGNSNNLTQNTLSNQPSIVLSGVLNTQNSKPVLITDGNSFMSNGSSPLNGTTNSIFATIKLTSTRGLFAMMSGTSNYNQHWPSRDGSGNNRYYDSGSSNITASPLPNGYNLINLHENVSGITVYENNSNLTTNFAHDTASSTGIVIFRRFDGGGYYMPNGSGYSELVMYGNTSKLSDNAGISANINSYYSIYLTDSDAQAFVTAAAITDSTQMSAINTLVTDLKSANIWSKMKAIYPFVGGSATAHKFNLKDPRDTDAAFRLGFYGGWTHSSTGAKPNGTTGYADTNLTPSARLASTSGFGFYSRTNSTVGVQADMGALYYFPIQAFGSSAGGTTRYFASNSNDYSSFTDTDTRGFYQTYRTDSTTVKSLKNTTLYSATLSYATPNLDIFIGARNEINVAQVFSLKEFAFAYIQENFTDSDAANLYTAVQKYQTTLGRQV